MKVNQIATTLNGILDEFAEGHAIVAEDLSNIVDVGKELTTSDVFENYFDKVVGKLIDRVGKLYLDDKIYKAKGLGLWRDGFEYGAILEKVRCETPDFEETQDWNLDTYQPAVFDYSGATVTAKYFNQKTTYTLKLSITKKQFKSAFASASEMNRFIAMIENRIQTRLEMAKEALETRTLVNLMAEKMTTNNNVVNLLTEYNSAAGTSLTAAKALSDKEFLRFAAKTIMIYKTLLSKPSTLYNNGGYVTFTNNDNLKAVFLTDFVKGLETTLYADTFNEEFVKIGALAEVPFWQGTGEKSVLFDRAEVMAQPASDSSKTVTATYVMGVMFDDRGAMVCNENPEVTSIYNPEANFYNYWYKMDCNYFNDTNENCVVFVLADPSVA